MAQNCVTNVQPILSEFLKKIFETVLAFLFRSRSIGGVLVSERCFFCSNPGHHIKFSLAKRPKRGAVQTTNFREKHFSCKGWEIQFLIKRVKPNLIREK